MGLSQAAEIFVVNSTYTEAKDETLTKIAETLEESSRLYVYDAISRNIVAYYDAADKDFSGNSYKKRLLNDVRASFSDEKKNPDVARYLVDITHLLDYIFSVENEAHVYLINSLFHSDTIHKFSEGYPNDGFIYLEDSVFGLIPTRQYEGLVFSVAQYSNGQRGDEYNRFYSLLVKEKFGATLEVFSFSDNASAINYNQLADSDEYTVNSFNESYVVIDDVRPECEQEDNIEYGFKTRSINFTVSNTSRFNSTLVYEVEHEGEKSRYTTKFNDEGVATFSVPKKPGSGVISVLDKCGDPSSQSVEYSTGIIEDEIVVSEIDEDHVRITGINPDRQIGDEIVITEQNTGKKWITTYKEGGYTIDIPIGVGRRYFEVDRPYGDGRQPFEVFIKQECRKEFESSIENEVGVLKFLDVCANGSTVSVDYSNSQYSIVLDSDGRGILEIPLECGVTNGTWTVNNSSNEFTTSYNCDGLVRVVLRWDQPVDLDLHIQEKLSVKVGDPGWIFHRNKNANLTRGAGFLNKDCTATKCQGTREEAYAAKIPDLDGISFINVMVDYYTRDNHEDLSDRPSETCGSGEYARVNYSLTWFVGNEKKEWKNHFSPIECNIRNSRRFKSGNKSIRIP